MASLVIQDAFDPYYAGRPRLGAKAAEQFPPKRPDAEKPDSPSRSSERDEPCESKSEH